jgi:hypothetical protein
MSSAEREEFVTGVRVGLLPGYRGMRAPPGGGNLPDAATTVDIFGPQSHDRVDLAIAIVVLEIS